MHCKTLSMAALCFSCQALTDQDATTEEDISLLIVWSVDFGIICNALDHFYGASCSSQSVTKTLGWQEDFSCWDVTGGISPPAPCGTWEVESNGLS